MKKHIFFIIAFVFNFLAYAESNYLGEIYTYINKDKVESSIVITDEDIKNSHCESLSSILENYGIQLISYGAYGLESKISIHGFTDDGIKVVIDDICVNNAQYGTFDFTSINLSNIEKIKIVKGGFTESLNDEGAVGGVIYITTKKQSLNFSFTNDSYIKTFFNVNYPIDTFNEDFTINIPMFESSYLKLNGKYTYANNKYYYKDYRKIICTQENSQLWDTNFNLNYLQYFGDGNTFAVNNYIYAGNKHCSGTETNTDIGFQKDYNLKSSMELIVPRLFDAVKLTSNLSYLKNIRFYIDNSTDSTQDVNTYLFSTTIDYDKLSFLNESFGLTIQYCDLYSTTDDNHIQLSTNIANTIKFSFNDYVLTIPLSFKVCNQNYAFVPKMKLEKSFGDCLLYIDCYRLVNFPNMDDLYWNSAGYKGNENLQIEHGFGGDIAFNWSNNILPINIDIFLNYYFDKIQWACTNNVYTPTNIEDVLTSGIDVDFKKSFFDDSLIFKFGGEYLYTKLLDKNSDAYGKRLAKTPDFTGYFICDYIINDFIININVNYTGKQYTTNSNSSYLKPYTLVNLSITYNFNKNTSVYVKIDNLLNQYYYSYRNYPMNGISSTFGIKMNF